MRPYTFRDTESNQLVQNNVNVMENLELKKIYIGWQ